MKKIFFFLAVSALLMSNLELFAMEGSDADFVKIGIIESKSDSNDNGNADKDNEGAADLFPGTDEDENWNDDFNEENIDKQLTGGHHSMFKTDPVRIRIVGTGKYFRKDVYSTFALTVENFRIAKSDDDEEASREVCLNDEAMHRWMEGMRKDNWSIASQEDFNKKVNERGFFEKHPKKLIAGAVVLTALSTGYLVHLWENR